MDSTIETPIETTEVNSTSVADPGCPHCVRTTQETRQNEEISMAFLLALVPVISLTFFGQIGLL
jgi:hypothetical protein